MGISHDKTWTAIRLLIACAASVLAMGRGVHAQSVEEFYHNRQIRMIIGHPPGDDYDTGARLLAKYLPDHIPGKPIIVLQNMPAAASVVAANYLYEVAPRDGSVFGSFSRNLPNQALLGENNIVADPRQFNWLGAASLPSRVCMSWGASPIRTMDDVFTREFVVAGSGAGSSLSIVPTVLNRVLDAKFRVIEGYQGPPDAWLAMQRGEVQGVCNSLNQFLPHMDLIRSGQIRLLLRAEEAPLANFPDVPSVYSRAKTRAQTDLLRFIFSSVEFGRPYVLPPGAPSDRVAAFRAAFEATLRDPRLQAEAENLHIDMTLRPAAELVSLLDKLYSTSPETLETVRKIIPAGRD